MASVHDVAAYILKKESPMTTWKLQKLVYYSQAWSLVWDEQPLFGARIEAWANGPVVPELYKKHRGDFRVKDWEEGDATKLTAQQKETVNSVLNYYGEKDGRWLSELTHLEAPWQDARGKLTPGARSDAEITHSSMFNYYNGLLNENSSSH